MATPSFNSQASAAGDYPSERFNKREQKLLKSVQVAFPYSVIAAGNFTTVGGDASESITVSGALSSDLCIVSVKTAGATPRSIVAAAAGTNAIAVTLSGDPSNDHVLSYFVIRAS